MGYVCVGVLFVIILVVAIKRRSSGGDEQSESETRRRTPLYGITSPYALKPTPEMIEDEQAALRTSRVILEEKIRSSGFVKPERLAELMESLCGGATPFARTDDNVTRAGTQILTVSEKKALGLNTRMKYTHEFISFFVPEKLKDIEPKVFISNLQVAAWHEAQRDQELLKFRRMGVSEIRICPCLSARGNGRDSRKYPIDSVPALPRKTCQEPFCVCYYIAVFD